MDMDAAYLTEAVRLTQIIFKRPLQGLWALQQNALGTFWPI
jgi:hypothetical protein